MPSLALEYVAMSAFTKSCWSTIFSSKGAHHSKYMASHTSSFELRSAETAFSERFNRSGFSAFWRVKNFTCFWFFSALFVCGPKLNNFFWLWLSCFGLIRIIICVVWIPPIVFFFLMIVSVTDIAGSCAMHWYSLWNENYFIATQHWHSVPFQYIENTIPRRYRPLINIYVKNSSSACSYTTINNVLCVSTKPSRNLFWANDFLLQFFSLLIFCLFLIILIISPKPYTSNSSDTNLLLFYTLHAYRRKKKCIRYMEGDGDDRGNDMDNMGGNMSDDNLGSCGSVDDVKTPPEDDIESLNHSLSSPGAFSGLSCLQSPSTSLASPLTPNAVLYNNNHIINNILNNNSSNNNSTSSSNHDNENNSSNDNNNNENNENRDNGVSNNNRNEINNMYRTPGNSSASNNNASNETNSNPSSSNREPLRLPPGCCGNEMAAILAGWLSGSIGNHYSILPHYRFPRRNGIIHILWSFNRSDESAVIKMCVSMRHRNYFVYFFLNYLTFRIIRCYCTSPLEYILYCMYFVYDDSLVSILLHLSASFCLEWNESRT